jgi:hypothetical protein
MSEQRTNQPDERGIDDLASALVGAHDAAVRNVCDVAMMEIAGARSTPNAFVVVESGAAIAWPAGHSAELPAEIGEVVGRYLSAAPALRTERVEVIHVGEYASVVRILPQSGPLERCYAVIVFPFAVRDDWTSVDEGEEVVL